MHSGKLVFAQVMAHLPLHELRRCHARYRGAGTAGTFMGIGVAHFFSRRFEDATIMLLSSLQHLPG